MLTIKFKLMINSYKDLIAFEKSFSLAQEIFEESKNFPGDEKYALTSQIRRSSRSVCSNIGEAYRKRQYESHFVSKISDADMENSETQIWLSFALACGYIDHIKHEKMQLQTIEIGKLIQYMIYNPEKFRGNIPLKKK